MECRRADGLNMGYDPFTPEMVAKYGAPGQTDDEGFNPYADTVGPGIYGGRVKRDDNGEIVIGKQYQVRYWSNLRVWVQPVYLLYLFLFCRVTTANLGQFMLGVVTLQ